MSYGSPPNPGIGKEIAKPKAKRAQKRSCYMIKVPPSRPSTSTPPTIADTHSAPLQFTSLALTLMPLPSSFVPIVEATLPPVMVPTPPSVRVPTPPLIVVPSPPPIVVPKPSSSPSITAIPSPSSVPSPIILASSNPTDVNVVVVDPPPHERLMIEPYGKG